MLRPVQQDRCGPRSLANLETSAWPIGDYEIDDNPRLENGLKDGPASRDEDRQGHSTGIDPLVVSDLRGP